jgi:delta(3,5)-delta(2,4)-dienoyl-CoA isomerase
MSTSSASPEYQKYKHFVVSAPSAGVAHVEINRPKKLNAFARDVWLEFGAVFEQLSADADVRAVVLSGAGDKAFTAGLDVVDSSAMFEQKGMSRDVARRAKALRATIEEFQVCVGAMEKCEKRECQPFLGGGGIVCFYEVIYRHARC